MRAALVLLSLLSSSVVSAAGTPLEPATIQPTGTGGYGAATAFGAGRFLTIWDAGAHIFGAISDADGNRISSEAFVVIPDVFAQGLSLLATGDTFTAFWQRNGSPWGYHWGEIDRDGRLLRQGRLRADLGEVSPLAWNGTHVLMRTNGTQVMLFDRDMNPVTPRLSVAAVDAAVRSVIVRRDGFFVLLVGSDRELVAITIGGTGTVLSTVRIRQINNTSFSHLSHAVGRELADGRLLIAFVTVQADAARLHTAVISQSGRVSDAVELPRGSYGTFRNLHLAEIGDLYSLYFGAKPWSLSPDPWRLAGIRLNRDGRPLGSAPVEIAAVSPFAYATNDRTALAITRDLKIVAYALTHPARVQPQVLSLTPTRQQETRIGANERGFVAVWEDFVGPEVAVHAAAIDERGQRTTDVVSFPGALASVSVASGPSDHLFVRNAAETLIATRIDAEGRLVEEFVVAAAHPWQRDVDAAWTGSGYLIVWVDFGGKLRARFGPADTREVPIPPPPPGFTRYLYRPRIAFDGATVLLVWNDTIAPTCLFPSCPTGTTTTTAMRLTPEGVPLDETPAVLSAARHLAVPLIAASDREFLIWTQGESNVMIIRAGTPHLHVSSQSAEVRSYSPQHATWNGREFVVAISGSGSYVGLARLDREGRLLDRKSAHGGDMVGSLHVAAHGGDEIVIAAVSDDFRPPRATTFHSSEFLPLPPPPSDPEVHVTPLPTGLTRISWSSVPGADGYSVEVWRAGVLMAHVRTDANQTSVDVPGDLSDRFVVRSYNAGGFSGSEPLPRRRSVRR